MLNAKTAEDQVSLKPLFFRLSVDMRHISGLPRLQLFTEQSLNFTKHLQPMLAAISTLNQTRGPHSPNYKTRNRLAARLRHSTTIPIIITVAPHLVVLHLVLLFPQCETSHPHRPLHLYRHANATVRRTPHPPRLERARMTLRRSSLLLPTHHQVATLSSTHPVLGLRWL